MTHPDPLVPPYIERLVPYTPGKPVEEVERELGIAEAVKLASNESPVGPPPAALEAMRTHAANVHRYPDAAAFELRSALAAHHGVTLDEICLGNGSNELIDLLCRTFASPADHGVIGQPSFVCYPLGLTAANVPFTAVPLTEGVFWDVDGMLAAIQPNTRLLFVANPNNPTGTHLGEAGLGKLLTEAPPEVLVVLDEAYVQFADAEDYRSALGLRELRERLVVLRTFSKAYGLAALRVGYAIGPAGLVGYLHRTRAPFNVGTLGQKAALAALGETRFIEEYVAMNNAERRRVATALEGHGFRVAPSQTNFLWVELDRPGKVLYERLLRLGVIIRPTPIERAVRISIGLPEENDRLLAALPEALAVEG
jgi:histidinol-phosphate aminotransferase